MNKYCNIVLEGMQHMSDTQTNRNLKYCILKLLILAVTLYAMLTMLHWPLGFTFFTQLSNLYAAAVAGAQLVKPRSARLAAVKFTAAVSVTVTFLVFLTVLAPLDPRGLVAAYTQDRCASLCMHFITPVLTVWDFLANDVEDLTPSRRLILLATLPPLLYYLMILLLSRCGLRWNGMTAPYLFLNDDAPAGWFGFMPETASYTTLGIGVFYAVLGMVGVFLLIGRGLFAAASFARGRQT